MGALPRASLLPKEKSTFEVLLEMVEERYQQAYENKEIEFFVERFVEGNFPAPRELMRNSEKSIEAGESVHPFTHAKVHISFTKGRHYVPYTKKPRKDRDR